MVLQLDSIEADAEVSVVSYCKKEDNENCITIKHKSSVNKVGEEYYEVHKVNPTTLLLKIENMADGNYVITVNIGTCAKEFNVVVNCK